MDLPHTFTPKKSVAVYLTIGVVIANTLAVAAMLLIIMPIVGFVSLLVLQQPGASNQVAADILTRIGYVSGTVLLLTILGSILAEMAYFKTLRTKAEETKVTFSSGFFNKSEVTVPSKKFDSVTISQGLIQRLFGVAKIIITSKETTIRTAVHDIEDAREIVTLLQK